MPDNYTPSQTDVAWTRSTLRMIAIGGAWMFPAAALVFTRSGERELTFTSRCDVPHEMPLQESDETAGEFQDRMIERVRKNVEAIGWKMVTP